MRRLSLHRLQTDVSTLSSWNCVPTSHVGAVFPFSALEKNISSRVKAELGNTKENSISGCIWLYVV